MADLKFAKRRLLRSNSIDSRSEPQIIAYQNPFGRLLPFRAKSLTQIHLSGATESARSSVEYSGRGESGARGSLTSEFGGDPVRRVAANP
ncbi:MAG: hypothetical protein A3E78_07095 [Alphaproteobacteria bacterium RIFCSPHIGHO2_12_FULL_63_12]|nr:MAG: hypothetical protein A3E78_07095 [Alphaproteobacteria bacterium RIFCSPHIGHO2_12_FULL_63_12]